MCSSDRFPVTITGAVESINLIEDENIEINGTLNDKTADISIKAKVVQSGDIGGGLIASLILFWNRKKLLSILMILF